MPSGNEYYICKKCGTIFARREIHGSKPSWELPYEFDSSTMCTKCGGKVVWQNTPEIRPTFVPGCLLTLLLLGFIAIIIFWFNSVMSG